MRNIFWTTEKKCDSSSYFCVKCYLLVTQCDTVNTDLNGRIYKIYTQRSMHRIYRIIRLSLRICKGQSVQNIQHVFQKIFVCRNFLCLLEFEWTFATRLSKSSHSKIAIHTRNKVQANQYICPIAICSLSMNFSIFHKLVRRRVRGTDECDWLNHLHMFACIMAYNILYNIIVYAMIALKAHALKIFERKT